MIDSILPARLVRQRPGALSMNLRPGSKALVRYMGDACFRGDDPGREIRLEISMNGFGLEEVYGRFLKEKIYSAVAPPLCGALVDLYV